MERTGGKPTKLDDSSLVELALQRDQGAFALLLEKYRSSLMSHVLKYVSVVEDAEDAMVANVEAGGSVLENDEIMVSSSKGTLIRTRVAEIRLCGRSSMGVRIMRLIEGSRVISIECTERAVSESEDEETPPEEEE